MDQHKAIEDIFNEELKEEILEKQEAYNATFSYILKSCYHLKSRQEIKSVPFLKTSCNFINQLLEKDDFLAFLDQFPKIKEYIMNSFFPGLTKLIITVSPKKPFIFPSTQ